MPCDLCLLPIVTCTHPESRILHRQREATKRDDKDHSDPISDLRPHCPLPIVTCTHSVSRILHRQRGATKRDDKDHSDLRSPTSDLRPQISDLRPQTSLPIAHCPLPIAHCQLPIFTCTHSVSRIPYPVPYPLSPINQLPNLPISNSPLAPRTFHLLPSAPCAF